MKRARVARAAGSFALAAVAIASTISGGTASAQRLGKHTARATSAGVVAKSYFCQNHPSDPKCVQRVKPSTGGGGTFLNPAGVSVVTGLNGSPPVKSLPATGGGSPASPGFPALPVLPAFAAAIAIVGLWLRRVARVF
jgi:hypothetical protein